MHKGEDPSGSSDRLQRVPVAAVVEISAGLRRGELVGTKAYRISSNQIGQKLNRRCQINMPIGLGPGLVPQGRERVPVDQFKLCSANKSAICRPCDRSFDASKGKSKPRGILGRVGTSKSAPNPARPRRFRPLKCVPISTQATGNKMLG